LKGACKVQPETTHPFTDSLIIDGSMFVQCHQPVKETFAEYANEFSEKYPISQRITAMFTLYLMSTSVIV
jgi:hypothetical protein